MLDWLKTHPFAVEAFFERSTVLTFALPPAQLQPLLPPALTLDTWEDRWAFAAVAMVQTRALRPAGFPAGLGQDFFLIGYRLFVRFRTPAGKRLRGLYILKSETNRPQMTLLGNLLTHYRYTTTDIEQTRQGNRTTIASRQSGLEVTFADDPAADPATVPLPAGSPFATWAQARRFAGPLPFTFSWLPRPQQMLLIEGQRENWTPRPLHIMAQHVGHLAALVGPGAVLASAFTVEHIPYRWRKGRLENWQP